MGLDDLRSDLRFGPLNGLWNNAVEEALTNNESLLEPHSFSARILGSFNLVEENYNLWCHHLFGFVNL